MKTEYKIFGVVSVFLYVACAVYAWWTWYDIGLDWVGTIALLLSALLTTMCGGFFWFVSRRIDPRPEDRPDAEIAEGAGEIGFFSPGSYWPFGIALCAGLMGLALAFWYPWLVLIAGVMLLLTIGGLLFEYYVGQNAHS